MNYTNWPFGTVRKNKSHPPFSVRGLSICTDTYTLICVPMITDFGPKSDDQPPRKIDSVLTMIDESEGETVEIETARLKEWTGPIVPLTKMKCPNCHGKPQEVRHTCNCEYCNVAHEDDPCRECEDGYVFDIQPIRSGRIGAIVIDLVLLAPFANLCPDAVVRFRATKQLALFFGAGWKFAITRRIQQNNEISEFILERKL